MTFFENHVNALGESFSVLRSYQNSIIWAVSPKGSNRIVRFEVWEIYHIPGQGWDFDSDRVQSYTSLSLAEKFSEHLLKKIKDN